MQILYSNKIVLSDDVINGYIVIDNDKIIDIQSEQNPEGEFIDLTGKYILPGFINVASDDYSNEAKSPYNKFFSEERIFSQTDRLLAESGVTTNFHTFRLEDLLKEQSVEDAIEYLNAIKNNSINSGLVNHKIHLVFRLGERLANRNLRQLIISGVIDFITCVGLHSRDVFNYHNQYLIQNMQRRFDLDDEQALEALKYLTSLREESALDELSYRIKSAKNLNLPFASNRYSLIKRLKDEYKIDIDIISGEHTPQTIALIKENDIHYIYDVEGFINTNDVSEFVDLISDKVVDIVSASTHSKDILDYIFEIEGILGLPEAVKLFSHYPAEALKLEDRGSISVGKKADFVVVEMNGELPTLSMTIANGKTAVQYNY
ncbi:MAG: amidohydrolase family protein [Peptostreptococcaceae bacterium]|nr:amidohydrolase family protein [Peptostreptococcaceae bacterium]